MWIRVGTGVEHDCVGTRTIRAGKRAEPMWKMGSGSRRVLWSLGMGSSSFPRVMDAFMLAWWVHGPFSS